MLILSFLAFAFVGIGRVPTNGTGKTFCVGIRFGGATYFLAFFGLGGLNGKIFLVGIR